MREILNTYTPVFRWCDASV